MNSTTFPDGNNVIAWLTNEASNKLRTALGFQSWNLLPAPAPRLVTRKDASLDNYFAELLLRTAYAPTPQPPQYEEIVLRGPMNEIPTSLNPQVADAILIGIGGMSSNPDVFKIYDEHIEGGMRRAHSASQLIFDTHYNHLSRTPNGYGLSALQNEISKIDAEGGAGPNHLSKLARNLHFTQVKYPDNRIEEFPAEWKRAVLSASLAAVSLTVADIRRANTHDLGKQLRQAWLEYRGKKRPQLAKAGYVPEAEKNDFDYAISITTAGTDPDHLLTFRRIHYALSLTWPSHLTSFVLNLLFEGMVQSQIEYRRTSQLQLNEMRLPGTGHGLYWYEMQAGDKLPNRGIMSTINEAKRRAFLLVRDPYRQIAALFRSIEVNNQVWAKVCDALDEEEAGRWFVMRQPDGTPQSPFILNGTRSHLDVEPSDLDRDQMASVLIRALKRRDGKRVYVPRN